MVTRLIITNGVSYAPFEMMAFGSKCLKGVIRSNVSAPNMPPKALSTYMPNASAIEADVTLRTRFINRESTMPTLKKKSWNRMMLNNSKSRVWVS